jgi:hypothetical protein
MDGGRFKGWKGSGPTSGKSASKYKSKITEYKGVKYHSKKEAKYAMNLDLLQQSGSVEYWKGQITMQITVNGEKICKYICDFFVKFTDGTTSYVDVKGMKTGAAYEMFKLKKKLVKATLGIEITEV